MQDKAKPKEAPKPPPPPPEPIPGFHLATLKQAAELKNASPHLACRFSPNGKWLYTSAQDNTIQQWDLTADKDGKIAGKKVDMAGHASWTRAIGFSADNKWLITAGYDGLLLTWPLGVPFPEPVRQAQAHTGWIRGLDCHGERVLTGGNDGRLAIHLLPDLRPGKSWLAHDCHIYQASFSPDGKFILSADLKGRLKVWDGAGQLVREFSVAALHKYDAGFGADIGGVRAWSFSPDGASIACSGITNVSNAFAGVGNPLILVANWLTGEIRAELRSKEAFQGTGWGVCWHKSGFILGAAGGNGGMLWAWKDDFKAPPANLPKKDDKKETGKDPKKPEEKKLEPVNEFVAQKLPDNVRDMALSADGKRLAIAYQGGISRVYALA